MEQQEQQYPQIPRKRRRRRSGVIVFWRVIGTLLAIGTLTCVIFAAIFMKYVHTTLDPVLDVDASAYTLNQSSVIYYQPNGSSEWVELQKVYGEENRTLIEFSDLPSYVWQALVSIEDERFFEHKGVDWKSTGKAAFYMLTGSDNQRGGSTLTQQVIKNLTGSKETTVRRKVTEIFRALRFAETYSREEVLEMYLNLVYFGDGAYGIQAASETYFGKDVSDLTLAEAAAIIGITQYPYKYDPSRGDWYREQNKLRQETVLSKMKELGYLDKETYRQALDEKLVFVWDEDYVDADGESDGEAAEEMPVSYDPYLVEQVFIDVVEDLMEQKGYSRQTAQDLLYTGGYKIYSTIDPEMQTLVESVYADTDNLNYTSAKGEQLQSGITVIDNATGNIVAMGGRIGARTGRFLLNYATNPRPCGSAIKPLSTYAPALETGLITPATVLDDYPVRLQMNEKEVLKAWPKNSYSGYKGLITLQTALRVSTNTTAVRVLEKLGLSTSYEFLSDKFGFTTLVNDDLNSASLALGGFTYGVSTEEMAAAYAVFANNGVYNRPRTYVEVRDSNGNVVLENRKESWVALKESTVYAVNELLKGVVRSGTGTEAAFSGMTIAGKTGTTSNNFDRYFVGYTPYYTAAVWIGYDYPTKISVSGNPAARLWKMVMSPIHETLPNADFQTGPSGMTSVTVCTRTGLLAGELCPDVQTVLVASGSAPVTVCDAHIHQSICTESGCIAASGCPKESVKTVNVIDYSAPNYAAAVGYERNMITEPSASAEKTETANGFEAAEPEGTVVYANDSDSSLPDLLAKGSCTLHAAQEMPEGDGAGTSDGEMSSGTEAADGAQGSGKESEDDEFLSWLAGLGG